MKKLRFGWFTFTCCEDSTIIFTELMNQHYRDWINQIEFVHAKVLKAINQMAPMDVAFVEGAISSSAQETKLKQIRELSKKLIAVGACACTGMPAAYRNQFDAKTLQEIQPILDQFQFAEKTKKI